MEKLMKIVGKKSIFIAGIIIASYLALGTIWSLTGIHVIDETQFKSEEYERVMGNDTAQTADLIISTKKDWLSFVDSVNNGNDYADRIVRIISDLDFGDNNINVVPVGTYQCPFRGRLYGNNCTISNVSIRSSNQYVGLIGVAEFAVIDGINLQDCTIYSESAIGTAGIVGLAETSTISDCFVEGDLFAEYGSVGGIVGNNFYSEVSRCDVKGVIVGSSESSMYADTSLGTGGIVGANRGYVYLCNNYATISDDCDTHESNTSRSGGIAGYNYSLIEACGNFGTVTGGGIAKANTKYSSIIYCVNSGAVYSGIAIGSYQDSTIEYCVNIGTTEGRYAGDIVSFWGQDSEENSYGIIKNCLYVNSSRSGVARKKAFANSSVEKNSRIGKLNLNSQEQVEQLLQNKEFYRVYNWLVLREKKQRILVICISTLILLVGAILFCLLKVYCKMSNQGGVYNKAKKHISENEYWLACKGLLEIPGYKDSGSLVKQCLTELFNNADETGVLRMGTCNEDTTIEWKQISVSGTEKMYLSESALAIDQIHPDLECKDWNESQLAEKLNVYYKERWFGPLLGEYIKVEVSLPDIKTVEQVFAKSSQRVCGNKYNLSGMLMSSGFVYWWLKGEIQFGRLPFVSADGLISDRGKMITAEMAIRPVIKVEVLYEENN